MLNTVISQTVIIEHSLDKKENIKNFFTMIDYNSEKIKQNYIASELLKKINTYQSVYITFNHLTFSELIAL